MSPTQSTRALEAMCDRGSISACMNAAQRHFEGKGAPASRAESKRWHQKACDAGDQQTCQRLEMQGRYDD